MENSPKYFKREEAIHYSSSGLPSFDDRPFQKKPNQLTLLLLSDIHLAFDYIQILKLWLVEHRNPRQPASVGSANVIFKPHYDYVLISGDLANIHYNLDVSHEEEMKAEQDISVVLSEIEKIVGVQILYIPGNHDPKSMLGSSVCEGNKEFPKLSQDSNNMHNDWVELKPNLGLVALGGSTPSDFQRHGDLQLDPIYFPYPYSTDEKFKQELSKLLDSEDLPKNILLMTHDGPRGSATCQDKTTHLDTGIIQFGSPYLTELLKNSQGRIICNVHGHCHEGGSLDKIQNIKVINPGSLKHGEFGELKLQENADGTWRVASFHKNYLD
eukprot:403352551